ncbi:MAG TPA: alpha-ketoglutarate-dependent dioxygenase AlkB [Nannocystaceae bacterium]|nr:alpha-ketoglutarate-dependent dioxygenase AlkB [Nannocystaceae bacterium]
MASSAAVAQRLEHRVRDLGRGAWLAHVPHFVDDAWLEPLRAELPLRQESLVICGREIATPRLTSWHGDPGAHYRYSGRTFEPGPWTPTLARVRDRLVELLGVRFHGVLANWYRDGNDAMGWHSDDERELGPAAPDDVIVASVSLGTARRFLLQARTKAGDRIELALGGGDLLVMGGSTQRRWRHSVPRERKIATPRLNLTFRLLRELASRSGAS